MGKGILTKEVKRSIGKVLTLFLLGLYIVGTSHLEVLHSFTHHDYFVTHSAEEEKDPCHLSIYHPETAQGCDHDAHLTVSDKCQVCDLVYHSDPTVLPNVSFATHEFLSVHFDAYVVNLGGYCAVISSSRAPPPRMRCPRSGRHATARCRPGRGCSAAGGCASPRGAPRTADW